MHWLNWVVVVGYLGYVCVDGIRRSRGTTEIEGYFLANRALPWWAVGLTVMATQLSAVTMIGTTGQGATDGMRFVQFYFGLPVAMVILGVTIVPFLYRAKVYTAYEEFLERRFDAKTRSLTSVLFLLSRALSCGAIIAAPAVVFSAMFGWSMVTSVALIGVPTVLYTMIGGVQAVTWADVKQMAVIVIALVAVVVVLLVRALPVSPDAALGPRRPVEGAPARLRFLVQPARHLHVLVRHHRRHLPDALVLRHGPEPGAAIPHREERRRSPQRPPDQRVLEDPAAGARPARRRAGVRLLSVPCAAALFQSGGREARRTGKSHRVPVARRALPALFEPWR